MPRPLTLGALLLLIGLDQLTKYNLSPQFSLPRFPLAVVIIITLSSYYLLYKVNYKGRYYHGLGLLSAGASSNLIDRLIHQAVLDPFSILSLVFNLADIYIAIGTAHIIFNVWINGSSDDLN